MLEAEAGGSSTTVTLRIQPAGSSSSSSQPLRCRTGSPALGNSQLPNARTGLGQEGSPSSQKAGQFCIVSWNSRGSSAQKLQFMRKLVSPEIVGDRIPILCNQENFILKSNSYKLYQSIPGFQFFVNPALNTASICTLYLVESILHVGA